MKDSAAAVAIWVVVPAAGQSRRFVQAQSAASASPVLKQLTLLDDRSLLATVLDVVDAASVAGVVVVVNPQVAPFIEAERPISPRRRYVMNDRPNSEMIESIQMGWTAIHDWRRQASESQAWGVMICPGDHPGLTTAALDRCIGEFRRSPTRIVIAAHQGRRGHPMIVPQDLVTVVAGWPPSARLSDLRQRYADRVLLVETGEAGILVDIDRPEDLEQWQLQHGGK